MNSIKTINDLHQMLTSFHNDEITIADAKKLIHRAILSASKNGIELGYEKGYNSYLKK